MPAGLNVFNSFFAPARPGRDRTTGWLLRSGPYSQVLNLRMYQVFTSCVSVQYASSTPISHGK